MEYLGAWARGAALQINIPKDYKPPSYLVWAAAHPTNTLQIKKQKDYKRAAFTYM